MVLELPAPGVEDAGEARCAALGFGLHHVLECLSALLDKDAVEFLGVFFTDTPQLGRNGEGDHEIRHGE